MASVTEQPTQDEIQEIIQNVSTLMALTSHCTDSFLSAYRNAIQRLLSSHIHYHSPSHAQHVPIREVLSACPVFFSKKIYVFCFPL
jgi:hypothetical protein